MPKLKQTRKKLIKSFINFLIFKYFNVDISLNTRYIAKKVKDALNENNISQKVFGKALLDVNERTMYLLLSKPKSWYNLNQNERELYCKMYFWLKDPKNINKIRACMQKGKICFS